MWNTGRKMGKSQWNCAAPTLLQASGRLVRSLVQAPPVSCRPKWPPDGSPVAYRSWDLKCDLITTGWSMCWVHVPCPLPLKLTRFLNVIKRPSTLIASFLNFGLNVAFFFAVMNLSSIRELPTNLHLRKLP